MDAKTQNILDAYENGLKAWVPDYDLIGEYLKELPGDGTFKSVAPALAGEAKPNST
jgi:hypothetical protein